MTAIAASSVRRGPSNRTAMGARKAVPNTRKAMPPTDTVSELPDLSEVEDHARDEETEQLHPHRKGEGYKNYVNEALWPEGCLHYANPFCSGD